MSEPIELIYGTTETSEYYEDEQKTTRIERQHGERTWETYQQQNQERIFVGCEPSPQRAARFVNATIKHRLKYKRDGQRETYEDEQKTVRAEKLANQTAWKLFKTENLMLVFQGIARTTEGIADQLNAIIESDDQENIMEVEVKEPNNVDHQRIIERIAQTFDRRSYGSIGTLEKPIVDLLINNQFLRKTSEDILRADPQIRNELIQLAKHLDNIIHDQNTHKRNFLDALLDLVDHPDKEQFTRGTTHQRQCSILQFLVNEIG